MRNRRQMPAAVIFAAILLVLALPLAVGAVSVKDQLGRTVDLPPDPHRVVALAPNITEIIFALGQQQRLKGVTRYSDYPPEAKKLSRVGTYVHLDLERIVALKPDLCIASRDGNPRAIIDRLESLHIPVFVVDPQSLESIIQTVHDLGAILNASGQADELAQHLQRRIRRVRRRVAAAGSRPRVFFQVGITPIIAAGAHTFINELIDYAGGRNCVRGKTAYLRFSREQVLALDPDILIICTMARGAVFEKIRKQWYSWPNLSAVRQNRVHVVDSDLFNRPSPRLVDSLELLAKLIHPELFEEAR